MTETLQPTNYYNHPASELGILVQLAVEAGSETKLLVTPEMKHMAVGGEYRELAMNGLSLIASGKYGEAGYHGINPSQAANMYAFFSTSATEEDPRGLSRLFKEAIPACFPEASQSAA